MKENFDELSDKEKLEIDNDFMKMKLMLEHNAHFGSSEERTVPPEIENMFLRNVMEFERQFENCTQIKIYDRIGKPVHFKPAAELSDDEIDSSWEEVQSLLSEHCIHLDVCSPNIPNRELYRFAIEELFDQEIDDIRIPGFGIHFTYDEFYPDPIYESSRTVRDELFDLFFSKKDEQFLQYCLVRSDINVNERNYPDFESLKKSLQQFKDCYTDLQLSDCEIKECKLIENEVVVTGKYGVDAIAEDHKKFYNGNFEVILMKDDLGYWSIRKVVIEGLVL